MHEPSNYVHICRETVLAKFVTLDTHRSDYTVAVNHNWTLCRVCGAYQYYSTRNRIRQEDIIEGTLERPKVQFRQLYPYIRGYSLKSYNDQKNKAQIIKAIYQIEKARY